MLSSARATPRRLSLALALLATAACGASDDGDTVDEVVVETRGDTTFVTNPATAPRVDTVPEVNTVWRSDELANPSVLTRAGDWLVVGDRTRIHLVSIDGTAHTVGSAGEGPGEFGWIAQMAVRNDTLFVLDGRLLRHSMFDLDGTFLGDHAVTWPTPHVNPPRNGDAMALRADSLVRIASENVMTTRAQRDALLVQPLEGGEARLVAEWDATEWMQATSGVLAPPVLFGPSGHSALAADGRYALGDGLDYCISVHGVGTPEVTRVCREWRRSEVGPGIRSASGADLPADVEPQTRDFVAAIIDEQEVGELHPSYDDLTFGSDGALWVRTVGPEVPDIHPMLRRYQPEPVITHFTWDRFERDGRLTRTVVLPTGFSPRVFDSDGVWGFRTLDTGEVVLAHALVPG